MIHSPVPFCGEIYRLFLPLFTYVLCTTFSQSFVPNSLYQRLSYIAFTFFPCLSSRGLPIFLVSLFLHAPNKTFCFLCQPSTSSSVHMSSTFQSNPHQFLVKAFLYSCLQPRSNNLIINSIWMMKFVLLRKIN